MKIIELIIDALDELTGVDAVALVQEPAIKADFLAFNDQEVLDYLTLELISNAFTDLKEKEEFGVIQVDKIELTGSIEPEQFDFAIQEDQQMLVGPLMIPNKLMFRVTEEGEPYYAFFSEDTIKSIAEKVMKNKLMNSLNLEHNPADTVQGYMAETWLVEDVEKDKQAVYGFSHPVGTWMGRYKIEDPAIWQKVKNKEIKGFSVEGFFGKNFMQSKA